jgi:hypothetical protein
LYFKTLPLKELAAFNTFDQTEIKGYMEHVANSLGYTQFVCLGGVMVSCSSQVW